VATAFYATFLPSRVSTGAIGFTDPAAGVTYPAGAVPLQALETLNVKVSQQSLSSATYASSNGVLTQAATRSQAISAGLPAPAQSADLRISPAGAPAAPPSSAAATPPCDKTVSPLYCVYTILPGDTLSGVAEKFGLKNGDVVAADLLMNSNKPDIASAEDLLQISQKLRIPTRQAVIHTVLSGDNLSTIAGTYDVSITDIVAVDVNHITDLNSLKVGDEVLVPNPKRFAPPPAAVVAPSGNSSSGSGSSSSSAPQVVAGGKASQSGFIWPVGGRISSYFGPAHPLGIDIDLHSAPNAPIGAAAAGTVTFAGGNACCSYGYYVVVNHGNGFETLYAHFSSVAVSTGQRVSQGQLLGYGGRTGYATGNHLHFEVHINSKIVNPLEYLP
jgi:murein DD-endopeptidase MepM/ murein hydrolase activator NlpD